MYRKNVAGQNLAFALVNTSTGAALPGATVTARRSIDGAAQASATGTVSELGNGQYNLALSQADTNGNHIGILLTATNAIPVHFSIVTTAADPTDGVRLGLTALPNAAAGAASGLITAGGTGNVLPTDAIVAASIAANAITNAKIATDAIDADALASDAVTEIQSGLATQASVNTIDDFLDTEIASIITTLGTPAGASISADIAAIEAQTDDIGAAGAGLTAIPWNAAWDAEVQSEVADALAVYDPPTHAELTAEIDTVQADIAALNDLTAVQVENAVWDAVMADHLDAGSTGASLNGAGSAGDPWTTALPGAYGAGTAGFILGTNLDAPVSDTATQTSVDDIPTNAELATALAAADDAVLAAVAAVQADTDNIQTRLPAALIAGRIEAIVGATATNSITAGSLNADVAPEIAAGVWDRLLSAHLIAGSAGLALSDLLTMVADLPTNAELATALGTSDDATLAAIAGLENLSAAEVNAEVVDALSVDTYAEPATVPAATASLVAKIGWLMALARNKLTSSDTTITLRNDADSASIGTAAHSEAGTTYTRNEWS